LLCSVLFVRNAQKFPTWYQSVVLWSFVFEITIKFQHGIRASPGSLKASKKLKEDFLLQQLLQQSEDTVKKGSKVFLSYLYSQLFKY